MPPPPAGKGRKRQREASAAGAAPSESRRKREKTFLRHARFYCNRMYDAWFELDKLLDGSHGAPYGELGLLSSSSEGTSESE